MKITRKVRASHDPSDADTYIVKIWHEIEADGEDTYGPEAAEEIFEIVARSPQEAKEYAKMQWQGPIDRIEIVDINPEYEDDYIPFDSCDSITSAEFVPNYPDAYSIVKLSEYLKKQRLSAEDQLSFFLRYLRPETSAEVLEDLADRNVIDLEDFFNSLDHYETLT